MGVRLSSSHSVSCSNNNPQLSGRGTPGNFCQLCTKKPRRVEKRRKNPRLGTDKKMDKHTHTRCVVFFFYLFPVSGFYIWTKKLNRLKTYYELVLVCLSKKQTLVTFVSTVHILLLIATVLLVTHF